MKRDVLALRIARKKLRAPNVSRLEVLAQKNRAVLVIGHPKHPVGVASRALLASSMEVSEQRRKFGLDGNASSSSGLRRLHFPRLSVYGLRDVDDAVLEIDVVPGERGKLIGARVRIDGHGIKRAEGDFDRIALDKARKLTWIKILLGPMLAALRWVHSGSRVVFPHPQVAPFRVRHVAAHLADEHPNVARGLPAQMAFVALVEHDLAVEILNDTLDGIPIERPHAQVADSGEDVPSKSPAIVTDGSNAARFAVGQPAFRVLGNNLARILIDCVTRPLGKDGGQGKCIVASRSGIEADKLSLPTGLHDTHADRDGLGLVGPLN